MLFRSSRLAEAHWNHVAWAGVLLSDELIDRRSQRFSGFPVPGPFRYRHVAPDSKTAAWVAKVRRDVWKQRNWDRRAGLQRFTRRAPKRTGKTTVEAPSVRTSRLPGSHIEEAVQVALATYGSRPGKLRPGQRRALLRTLSAAAIKHLHQGAWRDIEA